MAVAPAHLVLLSNALDYPTRFFHQSMGRAGAGSEIFHRKRARIPAGVLDRTYADATVRRMEVDALREALDGVFTFPAFPFYPIEEFDYDTEKLPALSVQRGSSPQARFSTSPGSSRKTAASSWRTNSTTASTGSGAAPLDCPRCFTSTATCRRPLALDAGPRDRPYGDAQRGRQPRQGSGGAGPPVCGGVLGTGPPTGTATPASEHQQARSPQDGMENLNAGAGQAGPGCGRYRCWAVQIADGAVVQKWLSDPRAGQFWTPVEYPSRLFDMVQYFQQSMEFSPSELLAASST